MTLAAAAAVAVLCARPIEAQQSAGSISGVVTDTAMRPLDNATVSIYSVSRSARTDDRGKFAIAGLPDGEYELYVLHIGYIPEQFKVRVSRGGSAEILAKLTRLPATLDTVVVRAKAESCIRATLDGFNCRRRNGTGVFLDYTQFMPMNEDFLAQVVGKTDGFRSRLLPRACGNIACATLQSTTGMRCVRYLVDGWPPNPETRPLPIRPVQVAAIEIYKEPTEVPPELLEFAFMRFGGDELAGGGGRMHLSTMMAKGCALVVYWTWDAVRSGLHAAPKKPG